MKSGRRMLDSIRLIDASASTATGRDLRQWRLEMGLDQRSLAKTLGVSQSTVSRAEAHNKREEWYARMVWLLWYGLEQQQLIANLRLALGEQMAARRSPAPHD